MRVYFLGTITGGREYVDNYKLIADTIESFGNDVLSKQVTDKNITSDGEPLSSSFIYERERKRIELAEVIIAEVSATSVSTGYFIHYALNLNKPVLVLNFKLLDQRRQIVLEGNPSENLYLEHYTKDNIKTVLKGFFDHVDRDLAAKLKGKLIAIEGTDGTGKSTQFDLLTDYLRGTGKTVRTIKFPRYEHSFYGRMVKRYLNGEFGDHKSISPYMITMFYALDRFQARDEIYNYLRDGDYVVADRYTWSNLAFRSASVREKDREQFLQWVEEAEYNVNKIPREDVIIVLYSPIEFVWKKMEQNRKGREYSVKSRDIHEADFNYLKAVEKQYLNLTKRSPEKSILIECIRDRSLRSVESVHFEILQKLKEREII